MNITIGQEQLGALLYSQLRHNFLCTESEWSIVMDALPDALAKVEGCFSESANKYFCDTDGNTIFNPYHSAQYSIFLYFLSHLLWAKYQQESAAAKVYLLNKMLSGSDLFYQIQLPDIFLMDHPVGTVLGRASYGNYLMFQQGCTVGGNKGVYPTLGEYVWLFAGATVIGNSRLGTNVFVSAGTYIKDEFIPDNTLVFGRSPNLILKTKPESFFRQQSPFRKHLGLA